MQRPASTLLRPLRVERLGDRERVGIELDDGVEPRPRFVDLRDTVEGCHDERARGRLPARHRGLQFGDRGGLDVGRCGGYDGGKEHEGQDDVKGSMHENLPIANGACSSRRRNDMSF